MITVATATRKIIPSNLYFINYFLINNKIPTRTDETPAIIITTETSLNPLLRKNILDMPKIIKITATTVRHMGEAGEGVATG